MKKLALIVLLGIALLVTGVSAGNGIDLNGAHFNLNLIGAKDKNMGTNLDSGHTIFVGFDRSGAKVTTSILLTEGSFKVIDKDGTDGTAKFQLPYPYTTLGGSQICYEVYVKALAKPTGYADMYTCVYDSSVATTYCDTGNMVTIRRSLSDGKFTKVTSALTTIDGYGPIFKDQYDDYWWTYDNYGLKHAQLRFYQTDACYQNTWV